MVGDVVAVDVSVFRRDSIYVSVLVKTDPDRDEIETDVTVTTLEDDTDSG